MLNNINEIEINNDDIYCILSEIVKLVDFALEDTKNIQVNLGNINKELTKIPTNN